MLQSSLEDGNSLEMFCSSVVSDSRNRWRLSTSSVDARVSELLQSVGGSKTELLPSDRMCKACFQSVEKLLKVESSASSIVNMLKASIQALALTQAISSTQSGQRGKRANTSEHANPPPKRPALDHNRLTPSTVSAKTSTHAQSATRKTLFPASVISAVTDTPDRQFLEHLSSQAVPSPVVKVFSFT